MKHDTYKPHLRPDVERRLQILVVGFFLIIVIALSLSTLLWPAY